MAIEPLFFSTHSVNMINVWLVRSPELSRETYFNVFYLLKSIPGVIRFHTKEVYTPDESEEEVGVVSDVMKDSWFYEQCKAFRKINDLGGQDRVIILSDLRNEYNFFLNIEFEGKLNGYVQTSGYDDYFPGSDSRFPVAYHIAVVVLMMSWFKTREEAVGLVNYGKSEGGISDYCADKREVGLKLRTADLSNREIASLVEKGVSSNLIIHVLDILESIRKCVLFKSRRPFNSEPLTLTINTSNREFYFYELGIELGFNPQEKAMYVTFLKNVNGIYVTHLDDFKDDVFKFYNNWFCMESYDEGSKKYNKRLIQVENLCNNNPSALISKLNDKIEKVLGESMAKGYLITGPQGGIRKIEVDRKFIKFENWRSVEQEFHYNKVS
jgi:hypothetical protein